MKYISTLLIVILSFSLYSQRSISGTVTDSYNEPLIGANIFVKGTKIGSLTNIDGTYTVDVPDTTQFLIYTYVGFYEQSVMLKSSDTIDVTMEEGEIIDCYSISPHYTAAINTDLINAPYGARLHLPYFTIFKKTVNTEISFQTNLEENNQLKIGLKYPAIYWNNDYYISLKGMFHSIRQQEMSVTNYRLTTTVDTEKLGTWLCLEIGGIRTQINSPETLTTHHGLSMGTGKYFINRRLWVSAGTNYLKSFWIHNAKISYDLGRYHFVIDYTQMGDYNELSLGAGYKIYY